ncbi:hypothetical protein [Streptomyces sp. 8L]|uniref:hypothetical protein n=1 Tax=Streptomyces sp. 8L TaxID=2877242 RepID=UPI001CD7F586|nr:hypothetical protein [Streptomyces sp. 8L]MCA1217253.1 hypothetical protein [Streptomyces sp. 8L]
MTPLYLALLALVVLGALAAYGLHRARVLDIPRILRTGTRAVVVLGLGSLAALLVDPADVPAVLRALLGWF